MVKPEKLGASPGRTYSSCITHRAARRSLALNVTLFLPAPRFAVPNTASRAGAPDAVLILSSSTFAPDSPDGVAVPASVNPLLFFLNELTVMPEVGFGPIVTLTVREVAATT